MWFWQFLLKSIIVVVCVKIIIFSIIPVGVFFHYRDKALASIEIDTNSREWRFRQ